MTADRFSRQSFLGSDSEQLIARCTVGVPGLGGGGSHIVQQLAHIDFKRYVLYEDDLTEESNLNRLVGTESRDARADREDEDPWAFSRMPSSGDMPASGRTIQNRCAIARL